jgi:hypothetical protein
MESHLTDIILALLGEDLPAAAMSVERFVESTKNHMLPIDVNMTLQWVIRESYLENSADLAYFASKVKYLNDVKETLRDELDEAQRLQIVKDCPPPGVDASDVCEDIESLVTDLTVRLDELLIDEAHATGQFQLELDGEILAREIQGLQPLPDIARVLFDTELALVRKSGSD